MRIIKLSLIAFLALVGCEQNELARKAAPPAEPVPRSPRQQYEDEREIAFWEQQLMEGDASARAFAAISLLRSSHPRAKKVITRALDKDSDPAVRATVFRAFGFDRNDNAISVLLAALTDNDKEIQDAAKSALCNMTSDKAVEQVCAFVDNERNPAEARALAIDVLGAMRHRAAVEPLIRALKSPNKSLKVAALSALHKISRKSYGPDPALWEEWWERHKFKDREEWLEELVGLLDGALKLLETEHSKIKKELSAKTIEDLQNRPDKSDPKPLLAAMANPDTRVRLYAVQEIVSINWPGQTDALRSALHDKDPNIRKIAADALGTSGDKKALPDLLAVASDDDASVRQAVAKALGKLAAPQACQTLERLSHDKETAVAAEAAYALGLIGNKKAVPSLISLLANPKTPTEIREAAAISLGKLADARALPALTSALKDKSERVRWFSAEALGQIPNEGSVEPLSSVVLHDPIPQVRQAATATLAKIGGEQAIPTLAKALDDKDSKVAQSAAQGLETLAGDNPTTIAQVADAFFEKHDYERAGKLYLHFLAKHGSLPQHVHLADACKEKLAISCVNLGELDRAKSYFQGLVEAHPTRAPYSLGLIDCLLNKQQPEQALAECLRALSQMPDHAPTYWNLIVKILRDHQKQLGPVKSAAFISTLQKAHPDLGGQKYKEAILKLRPKQP